VGCWGIGSDPSSLFLKGAKYSQKGKSTGESCLERLSERTQRTDETWTGTADRSSRQEKNLHAIGWKGDRKESASKKILIHSKDPSPEKKPKQGEPSLEKAKTLEARNLHGESSRKVEYPPGGYFILGKRPSGPDRKKDWEKEPNERPAQRTTAAETGYEKTWSLKGNPIREKKIRGKKGGVGGSTGGNWKRSAETTLIDRKEALQLKRPGGTGRNEKLRKVFFLARTAKRNERRKREVHPSAQLHRKNQGQLLRRQKRRKKKKKNSKNGMGGGTHLSCMVPSGQKTKGEIGKLWQGASMDKRLTLVPKKAA